LAISRVVPAARHARFVVFQPFYYWFRGFVFVFRILRPSHPSVGMRGGIRTKNRSRLILFNGDCCAGMVGGPRGVWVPYFGFRTPIGLPSESISLVGRRRLIVPGCVEYFSGPTRRTKHVGARVADGPAPLKGMGSFFFSFLFLFLFFSLFFCPDGGGAGTSARATIVPTLGGR